MLSLYQQFKHYLLKEIRKDFIKNNIDENDYFDLTNTPFVKYKSFGEKNPDKCFYVIYREPYEAGFFSNLAYVIRHLKLIEGTNLIPFVDFENFKTHYNNDKPINGTDNSWEYYFEQLSPYTAEDIYQSKNVLFCDGVYPHNVILTDEEKFKYYNKVFKIKPHIKEALAKYEKEFLNNKVLGIHFRGKDINSYPDHHFGPTEKQIFKYTDEIIEKFGINKIFIATDEKKYLENFEKRYADMVFYTDNFRTSGVNEFNVNPRENHRYLLGQEVLIDFILLLKCNGLLHSFSNIPRVAKVLNPHYEFTYQINNGVNSKNKYIAGFSYKIKKRLPSFLGGLLDEVEISIRK